MLRRIVGLLIRRLEPERSARDRTQEPPLPTVLFGTLPLHSRLWQPWSRNNKGAIICIYPRPGQNSNFDGTPVSRNKYCTSSYSNRVGRNVCTCVGTKLSKILETGTRWRNAVRKLGCRTRNHAFKRPVCPCAINGTPTARRYEYGCKPVVSKCKKVYAVSGIAVGIVSTAMFCSKPKPSR